MQINLASLIAGISVTRRISVDGLGRGDACFESQITTQASPQTQTIDRNLVDTGG
jgi:hypothetical protein